MTKGLADSGGAYTGCNDVQKTKQKNAQLCFAQKTLRLTKTIRTGSVRIRKVVATDVRERQLLSAFV